MQAIQPYLSIISPCYNVENYVQQTIYSVLNQSYQNWEYILIDDGSTDSTPLLLDQFAKKDNRIRVIHKSNGGVSSARNTGIELAKGDWVIFLDSDDWLAEDALNEYVNCTKDIDADVYHVNSYTNKGNVEIKRPSLPNMVREGDEKRWLVYDTIYPYIDKYFNKVDIGRIRGVNSKMYKRTLLLDHKIRFDENLKIAEDALFNFYAYNKARKVAVVNKYLLHYRINEDSVMHKFNPYIIDVNNKLMLSFFNAFKDRIDIEKELDICFTGLAAECIFRAMKLDFLNPDNKKDITQRIKDYKLYLKSEIIQKALKSDNLRYMQKGKKQILWCINHGLIFVSLILGKIAIAYLSRKSEI